MYGQEILAMYGVEFPRIPDRRLRIFEWHGEGGRYAAEVTAPGAAEPEWSALANRPEALMGKVRERYGLTPAIRRPPNEEDEDA